MDSLFCLFLVFFVLTVAVVANMFPSRRHRYSIPDETRGKNVEVPRGQVRGYKKLIRGSDGVYKSAHLKTRWDGGYLKADYPPSYTNKNGIYLTKSPDDPELAKYAGEVFEVDGYGRIVEHERGYRVHRARKVRKL